MSQSYSKQPMSGLKSVQRDFSANTIPSSSQSSEDAYPRKPPVPGATGMTAQERRLQIIQAALNGDYAPEPKAATPSSSLHSFSSKRPSSSQEESEAKRRHLPSSWDESTSQPSSLAPNKLFGKTKSFTDVTGTSSAPSVKKIVPSGSVSSDKPAAVFLSQEQTHILKLVENGESIFYTGSAGTGKSVLLREIIKVLRKRYSKSPDAVAITASTGIAACNIGGVTIHSFAGIGIGMDPPEQLANRIRKNKKAMSRWQRTKVLIIDEGTLILPTWEI
ncbi:hypothetical protein BDW22DRAFT_1263980 [Trametopsis cervina]|nr:hypothetical protein BDW22DRAFT_1263980 [Trametopsis cervina]